MKRFTIAIPLACGMLVMAPAMPTPIQSLTVTAALAGTYEDNVFPRGFPRWGSSPRFHEDRNRQYQGGMQRGGHFGQQSQGFGAVSQSGCGGGCVTARPTCGTRCKPKCTTGCNAAGLRQANTAKVSNIKSVIKGDNNTVNQTVNVNQINVNGVAARAPASSGGGVGTVFRGTAKGSANMAGMQLSVTTVTCTMSNGTAGLVAKVNATGEGRCVQKR